MKLLLWLAIGFVVVWLLRSKKQHLHTGAAQREDVNGAKRGAAELMVRCAHCGIYLPASEALSSASGAVFCCEEHRGKQPPV